MAYRRTAAGRQTSRSTRVNAFTMRGTSAGDPHADRRTSTCVNAGTLSWAAARDNLLTRLNASANRHAADRYREIHLRRTTSAGVNPSTNGYSATGGWVASRTTCVDSTAYGWAACGGSGTTLWILCDWSLDKILNTHEFSPWKVTVPSGACECSHAKLVSSSPEVFRCWLGVSVSWRKGLNGVYAADSE